MAGLSGSEPLQNNEQESLEISASFESMISSLVRLRERYPHNRSFRWCNKDIQFVRLGFKFMTPAQRKSFIEKFSNYQIARLLRQEDEGTA